jgi:hypothetical protein
MMYPLLDIQDQIDDLKTIVAKLASSIDFFSRHPICPDCGCSMTEWWNHNEDGSVLHLWHCPCRDKNATNNT